MMVFGKALPSTRARCGVDEIVLVRGRIDHKEKDKTTLIVQSVERFEPTRRGGRGGARGARRRAAGPAAAAPEPRRRRDRRARDDHRRPQARARQPRRRDEVVLDDHDLGRRAHAALRRRLPRQADADAARRARRRSSAPRALGGRRRPSAACRRAARVTRRARAASPCLAQPLAERAISPRPRLLLVRRPASPSTHGSPSKRGSERNARAALAPDLALADAGVAVAVGAERRLAVVEVQRAEPVEPDDRVEVVEHGAERRRRCARRSRWRACGRSRGRRRAARPPPQTSSSRASSSNERPSVPPAPAVFSRCSGQRSDSVERLA